MLAGFFFVAETVSGPPFGVSRDTIDDLLGGAFEQVADAPVDDSLPVFAGRERWQIWKRRGAPDEQSERPD